jgi:hypothetical protein
VGWIGVAGIVALAILIAKILNRDDITTPHAILVMIFAAMVFAVVFAVVRQISKLSGKHPPIVKEVELFSRESLPHAGSVPQLDPFRQPASSVTEHTTRTFDEAFVKKAEN